jgi:hypothetical protein
MNKIFNKIKIHFSLWRVVFWVYFFWFICGLVLTYYMPMEQWRNFCKYDSYIIDVVLILVITRLILKRKIIPVSIFLIGFIGTVGMILSYGFYQFRDIHPWISAFNNLSFDFSTFNQNLHILLLLGLI